MAPPLLTTGVAWSDAASAVLFRGDHLAASHPDTDVVPFEQFPYNGYDVLEPAIDFDQWALTVGGAVTRPGALHARPDSGAAESDAQHPARLRRGMGCHRPASAARALRISCRSPARTPEARFLTMTCADDYYESLDMETARHPQSLLCYEMYGRPLDRGHGAPLRLNLPTKLGYKQAKYLMTMDVTHVLPAQRSYWGDQGYSWYGGL